MNATWTSFASRAAARAPRSVGEVVLGEIRARALAACLVRHGESIAAVRAAAATALAHPGGPRPAGSEPFDGAAALAGLAERLVGELRAEVGARARAAGGAARLAAWVDARMPTDEPEHMDLVALPAARRAAALDAVDTWNHRFGNYTSSAAAIAPMLRDGDTLVDLAAGHGGFVRALGALLPHRDLRYVVTDRDPAYLALGADWAATRPDVRLRTLDASRLATELHPGEADVIVCTQALHHFGVGGAALVLAQALACARAIAFVDLHRSALRLAIGGGLARLGSTDGTLAHDTVVSFRRAFVVEELALLARLVPGGEALEVYWQAPGFVVVRGPASGSSAGKG